MEKNYSEIFARRTKMLSVDIISKLSEIPYSDKTSVIRKQIFRSSSSSAANYRAMLRSRSLNERFSKICIVGEEADETLFWIEFMKEIELYEPEVLRQWFYEAEEIVKATSVYKKYLKDKIRSNS